MLLYVIDKCNISKLVKYIIFADDKHLFMHNTIYKKTLGYTVCSVLDKISTWFAVNMLILNIYKTNYMLFGNRMLSEDVVINIQNVIIERVSCKICG